MLELKERKGRGQYERTPETKLKQRNAKLGKPNSSHTKFKKGVANLSVTGENNRLWKGANVGYKALHEWVIRRLGSPKECSECGFTSDNSRQFHWANISHEYKRDLTDWARLCVSCHRLYDHNKLKLTGVQNATVS